MLKVYGRIISLSFFVMAQHCPFTADKSVENDSKHDSRCPFTADKSVENDSKHDSLTNQKVLFGFKPRDCLKY
jgi:hypothetical protein